MNTTPKNTKFETKYLLEKHKSKSLIFALIMIFFSAFAHAIEECSGPSNVPYTPKSSLFSFDKKPYDLADLDLKAQQAWYEIELAAHHQKQQVIEDFIWRDHLNKEAEKQNKSIEAVIADSINIAPPSENEIMAFYQQNKEQITGDLTQVRQRISQFLMQEKAIQYRQSQIKKIKHSANFESNLAAPIAPVLDIDTSNYPSKGPAGAPVTVVEFADYQCPHCKDAAVSVTRLQEKYGDQVQFVFMDFPINASGISRKVAEGAVCADQQNKFWEFHEQAFTKQSSLNMNSPVNIARSIGLDMAQFQACINSEEAFAKVKKSQQEGHKVGVTGTPSFFVNGVKIHSHGNLLEALDEAIAKALK